MRFLVAIPTHIFAPRLIMSLAGALGLALAAACGASPTPTTGPGTMPPPTAASATDMVTPPAMATPCEDTVLDKRKGGQVGDCAPEFAGTQEWINSEPLTMAGLRGQVVLIDFWTYTCVNCIRTLPFLREWHERYASEGLVIVGVHTPEFEFEKIYQNVKDAARSEGVAWPVVQDNEFSVWRSYSNRYWPAKYLIDQTGEVRYTHFGEGKYAETEEWIRTLLQETGMTANQTLPLPEDQQRDPSYSMGMEVTRELFAGWKFTVSQGRGGIAQGDEYLRAARESLNGGQSGVTTQFTAPDSLENSLIYFNGPWVIGPESARHAEMSDHFDSYIALKYSARSVNAVLTSESGSPYTVRVTVNGEYLTRENRGADITIDQNGVSYLQVTGPRLYKIVEHSDWMGEQTLRLASMSDDFGLYSFTFGVYEDGY